MTKLPPPPGLKIAARPEQVSWPAGRVALGENTRRPPVAQDAIRRRYACLVAFGHGREHPQGLLVRLTAQHS
jgi:hypothetical protein